jgi:hypothetical protein
MTTPAATTVATSAAAELLDRLADGDHGWLVSFTGQLAGPAPRIHDPGWGTVGPEGLEEYVHERAAWLRERSCRAQLLGAFEAEGRTVVEGVWALRLPSGELELPVAAVVDAAASDVRIYHSYFPIEGQHRVRPRLLHGEAPDPGPGVVRDYLEALGRADVDGTVALFETDGYFREPSGPPFLHWGRAALREHYVALYSEGGIHLEHNTLTDDGRTCAMEFTIHHHGTTPVEPQAGLAVYERGRNGLLAAARIYDDILVPGSEPTM